MSFEEQAQKAYWEADKSRRRSPDHPAVQALFEPRSEYLASLVVEAKKASVVDVGCGNGFLTRRLEERFGRTVGVDYSKAMLSLNPCRETVCASATELPFADDEFDVAVESHLLHHLIPSDRLRVVQEMARVARRAVVLYEPNRNNPLMYVFGLLKREERMSLCFSPRYLKGLATEAGFLGVDVQVEGLIVPNKAPKWWVPFAVALNKSTLRHCGFYTRVVARQREEAK